MGLSGLTADNEPRRILRSVPSVGSALRPIVLSDVGCNGTEAQLGDCLPFPPTSAVIAQCSHMNDAGARCGNTQFK